MGDEGGGGSHLEIPIGANIYRLKTKSQSQEINPKHCALYRQLVLWNLPRSQFAAHRIIKLRNSEYFELITVYVGRNQRTVYGHLNIQQCTKHIRRVQRTFFIFSYL